jgi:hypothetical protein
MQKKLYKNQKPFNKSLSDQFDPKGKSVLVDILKHGNYTDIVVRKDEMNDGDKYFWDVKGINKYGRLLYFDVEVKRYWKRATYFPELLTKQGFSIANRKSKTHNLRHGKTNYIVIISADMQGAFFVPKETFEAAAVIEKDTSYGRDKFRNVEISKGITYIKKDGTWQKQ